MERSVNGTVFLASVCIDGLLSVAGLVLPALEPVSNVLSTLVLVYSLVILILSAIGRLPPRLIFVTVSAIYLAAGASGLLVVAALVAQLGLAGTAQLDPQQLDRAFLSGHVAWYTPFLWVVVAVYTTAGIVGLVAYERALARRRVVRRSPAAPHDRG